MIKRMLIEYKSNEVIIVLAEIKGDLERVEELQKELKIVDYILNSLTEQERYILEEKYLKNKTWCEVEDSFNNLFRIKPRVQQNALQRRATRLIRDIDRKYFKECA